MNTSNRVHFLFLAALAVAVSLTTYMIWQFFSARHDVEARLREISVGTIEVMVENRSHTHDYLLSDLHLSGQREIDDPPFIIEGLEDGVGYRGDYREDKTSRDGRYLLKAGQRAKYVVHVCTHYRTYQPLHANVLYGLTVTSMADSSGDERRIYAELNNIFLDCRD